MEPDYRDTEITSWLILRLQEVTTVLKHCTCSISVSMLYPQGYPTSYFGVDLSIFVGDVHSHNIPCDQFNEHLNRLCKEAVGNLQANQTEKATARVSWAIGTLHPVIEQFNQVNSLLTLSGTHFKTKLDKDRNLLLEEIDWREQVFMVNQLVEIRRYFHMSSLYCCRINFINEISTILKKIIMPTRLILQLYEACHIVHNMSTSLPTNCQCTSMLSILACTPCFLNIH